MAERHTKAEGLDMEFLEGQSAGLLPDRLEMRRRRRWRRRRRGGGGGDLVVVIVDDGNQFNNGIYNWPQP